MSTILFKNVGPNKRTWSKTIPGYVDCEKIAKEAKKTGGLMSRGVDACFDEKADLTPRQTGKIFVGMFRHVGDFELIDEQP